MSAWQPIETAPKDETDVLITNDRGQFVACFDSLWSDDGWWLVRDGKFEHTLRGGEPTHWMPLPPPPPSEQDDRAMTDPNTLADQVEALAGPDREVDCMITSAAHPSMAGEWRVVGPPTYDPPRFFSAQKGMDWIGYDLLNNAPFYTSSLDAAMTLYINVPQQVPTNPRKAVAEALRQRIAE